jgi:hypothetical protein
MKKHIHIHAKCPAFEFFEQVEESKAVRRLITIRNNFLKTQQYTGRYPPGGLVVKTKLVNPELF